MSFQGPRNEWIVAGAGEACPLLLASAGGRTPEPAAARSHTGPDRVASATDGIGNWWAKSAAAESGYSGVGVRRGVAKVGWNLGHFGLCGADGRPSEVLPMKIVSQG